MFDSLWFRIQEAKEDPESGSTTFWKDTLGTVLSSSSPTSSAYTEERLGNLVELLFKLSNGAETDLLGKTLNRFFFLDLYFR